MGPSWGRSGCHRAISNASWAILGRYWGLFWGRLEPPESQKGTECQNHARSTVNYFCLFGPSWRCDLLGFLMGPSWGPVAPSWGNFGGFAGDLGAIVDASRRPFGSLSGSLDHLEALLSRPGFIWRRLEGMLGDIAGHLGAARSRKTFCNPAFPRRAGSKSQGVLFWNRGFVDVGSDLVVGPLGVSWGSLGSLLALLWGALGASWGLVGAPCRPLKTSRGLLGGFLGREGGARVRDTGGGHDPREGCQKNAPPPKSREKTRHNRRERPQVPRDFEIWAPVP